MKVARVCVPSRTPTPVQTLWGRTGWSACLPSMLDCTHISMLEQCYKESARGSDAENLADRAIPTSLVHPHRCLGVDSHCCTYPSSSTQRPAPPRIACLKQHANLWRLSLKVLFGSLIVCSAVALYAPSAARLHVGQPRAPKHLPSITQV